MKRVAVIAIRLCPRHQESLQGAADRRQGDPRLLFAFLPRRCRGLLFSSLFQGQETIGQHHQAGVVVKPAPRATLKMFEAQFFLHLLVALLHRAAAFPEPQRLDPTGAHRQIREGVLDLAVGPLLDQQPDRPAPAQPPWTQSWPGQTRTQANFADNLPLVPSRQVTLWRGRHSASDFRLTGRGLSSARWGRRWGQPPVGCPWGQSQRGSSVKTTISGVTPAM